jgi:hypothetical protein
LLHLGAHNPAVDQFQSMNQNRLPDIQLFWGDGCTFGSDQALLRMEPNCMEAAASIARANIAMAIKISINENPF